MLSVPLAFSLIVQTSMTQGAYAQQAIQTIGCAEGFDVVAAPVVAFPLKSLKTVANPVLPNGANGALRADLAPYIANQAAAIQLGKALFWDIQAGSDNKTACASCHFQAGADVRVKNQLHPGADNSWNAQSVNAAVAKGDFPFSTPTTDLHDNAVGSQGVRAATFNGITNLGTESTTPVTDAQFGTSRRTTGLNAPSTINAVFNHRNFFNGRAQPDFNGVNPFGARDPGADTHVWTADANGNIVGAVVRIDLASLASQAVGPPTNDVEMSATGRTFPDIGKKLLKLKPLGLQSVDIKDSVLSRLAETKVKGLKTTYPAMIQAAFQPQWWNSQQSVMVSGLQYSLMEANFSLYWGLSIMMYEATLVSDDSPMDQFLDGRTFTAAGALRTEGNTAKLNAVARRLATDYGYGTRFPSAGGGGVAGILNGLKLFEKPLRPAPAPNGRECIACHLGATTTSATVANVVAGGLEPGDAAFKAGGFDLRMERMFMQVPPVNTDIMGLINNNIATFATTEITYDPNIYAVAATKEVNNGVPTLLAAPKPAPVVTYDAGWYNVGARPTPSATANPNENPGVGGLDPFGSPLSWVEYLQQTASNLPKIPGGTLGCNAITYNPGPTPPTLRDPLGVPLFPAQVLNRDGFPMLSGQISRTEATDAAGSFKTSSLRNLELSGPYFHNGGKSTLRQVIEMYDDGADFPKKGDINRDAGYPLDRRSPLVKFYGVLADHGLDMTPGEINDLVAFLIAFTDERVRLEKAPFDHPELPLPAGEITTGTGLDEQTLIPAVGALGRAKPVTTFLGLNPFE